MTVKSCYPSICLEHRGHRDEYQKFETENILQKYKPFFSSILGECQSFEYGFFLQKHQPETMKERPITSML
jgi:hypothetical protein